MRDLTTMRLGALLFALGLSACGGSRGTVPLPAGGSDVQSAGAVSHGAATGTLVLALPPILSPSAVPSPGVNQLSSGTRSIAGSFGNSTIAPIALTASTSGCSKSASGLTCTLRLRLPSGSAALHLQTFEKASGTGLPLAHSQPATVRVDPGVDNYPRTVSWSGIIRSLRVTVDPPEVTVTIDKNQRTVDVTAFGADASGAPAVGTKTIVTGGNVPSLELEQSGFQASKIPFEGLIRHAVKLNGQKSGKLTFTASEVGKSPVLTPASATLLVRSKAGVAGLGSTIAVSGNTVTEFQSGASGATQPLRTLFDLPVSRPYGTDAHGNFWMSNRHYSNTGDLLGTIEMTGAYVMESGTTDAAGNVFAIIGEPYEAPCDSGQVIVEYAAGDYSGKTIRKIGYNACMAQAIAIDASGFIYTYSSGDYDYDSPAISKWPANASGNVSPLSTVTVPPLSGMISDASGNLYAIELAQQNALVGTLVKFVPGSSTPQTVLPGTDVAGFAMDSSGNTFAQVPTSSSGYEIETFAAGSTTPNTTISSASLKTPMGITVVP